MEKNQNTNAELYTKHCNLSNRWPQQGQTTKLIVDQFFYLINLRLNGSQTETKSRLRQISIETTIIVT